MIELHPDLIREAYMRLHRKAGELEDKLKRTELERDDFHRELMDLRYQLELAKA